MRALEPGRVQAGINVTPLVDVVLVLLIIFMILAPQMHSGPVLELPETDRPPEKTEDRRHLVVALGPGGALWVEGRPATWGDLPQRIREAAAGDDGRQVLIQGDARLTFGEVRQAMRAVEAAGFRDVGLLAERRDAAPAESTR